MVPVLGFIPTQTPQGFNQTPPHKGSKGVLSCMYKAPQDLLIKF